MTAILSSIAAGTSVLTDAMSGSAISSTKHFVLATSDLGSRQMEEGHTMIAMRHYLGEFAQTLDGSISAEPIIRALMDRAVSPTASTLPDIARSALPPASSSSSQLAGGGTARRRGCGSTLKCAATNTAHDRPAILCAGQSAHAVGA